MANTEENLTAEESAFRNVVQTWKGGERKLAGARASELIYGASKKPNEKLQDRLLEEIPELKDFISAPVSGMVVDTVTDRGEENAQTPANLSSDKAKEEQDAIDDTLKAGREAREDKRDIDKDTVGNTSLSPPENPRDPLDHDGNGRKGGVKSK